MSLLTPVMIFCQSWSCWYKKSFTPPPPPQDLVFISVRMKQKGFTAFLFYDYSTYFSNFKEISFLTRNNLKCDK